MTSVLIHVAALLGAAFTLLAAVGLARLPDSLWRMHAAAKAGTLGAGLLLVAVALAAPPSAASRAVAAALFLVLTAPLAAHVLARRVGFPKTRTRRTPTTLDRREAA